MPKLTMIIRQLLVCAGAAALVNIYRGFNFINNNHNKAFEDEYTPKLRSTLHVIHCLSGNDRGFIEEWEIAIKSILVNAPLDHDLHVHLLADNKAAQEIDSIATQHKWVDSIWRNQIEVIVHNVEEMIPGWREFLTNMLTTESNRQWMDERVGIGGYFRLLAHRIIVPYECRNRKACTGDVKKDLQLAVYMDTDVIIISNLNHLRYSAENTLKMTKEEGRQIPLWMWRDNSGFIILDLTRFEQMWKRVEILRSIARGAPNSKGDQSILAQVEKNCTSFTAEIPLAWSTHIGHDDYRPYPHRLIWQRKEVGMLHFTSPGWSIFGKNFMDKGGPGKWCEISRYCNQTATQPGGDMYNVLSSWGLAEYYAKLSWDWAFFQGGTSRIRPNEKGHVLKYVKNVCHPDSTR